MPKKKVKLAFICNDVARKATFNKRKKGLLNKVEELSTLCGVEACAIIYGTLDSHPDVWPSTMGVRGVLNRVEEMPKVQQNKRMLDLQEFLTQRRDKMYVQLRKHEKDVQEKEATLFMFQLLRGQVMQQPLTLEDMKNLMMAVEQYQKDIQLKRYKIKINNNPLPPVSAVVDPWREGIMQAQAQPVHGANMNMEVNPQEEMVFSEEQAFFHFGDNDFNTLQSIGFSP